MNQLMDNRTHSAGARASIIPLDCQTFPSFIACESNKKKNKMPNMRGIV